MKTILIATDFSPASINAANYAVAMASKVKADIMLFHSFQMPMINNEVPIVVNYIDFLKTAETELESLKEKLMSQSDSALNISTQVKMGSFFDELKTLCDQIKPYAVILGSQGSSALENFLYGSETVYAMKYLVWPIIAVPPSVIFSTIDKIGLASDFDHVIDTTPLNTIKMLVNDFSAQLHVMNIGKKTEYNPDTVFESGMLQELLFDLKPIYHVFDGEDTDQALIDFVDQNGIDLLMIIPKEHSIFDKIMHKSHTKQLILKSHIPVVALHQ